ncbi:mandelate racemase/muconate lactonizing enzyme family protein [Actinocrispum wychmicini]|uniref:L-alanine-DL-glutamate epimerase-like enolase superfamily enzyme n=1 Tax=Actinocrispum wychmicini TaxID=1213861 RepID=A0A4R2JBT8_9PSEU|nr:mandelate racemase/muconate lactonizing enzyme family protein [Actinocrispum wychmicini]TCO55857.1 L-alanine-DL-glutamate epimerase-like enolase superfamily enzyme [Actinocrispum wychmicini]
MKISDVSPILLRGDEAYGTSAGSAEATDQGDWLLLVRVRTDDGLEAWSDVETLGPVAAAVIAGDGMGGIGFRTLAEELIGKDPLEVESRWDELYLATAYYGRRGVVMHCISAVDNCLWSLRAQAQGVDLAQVLGGRRRDRLPAYASTLFRDTPLENANAAARYVQLGFRGVKFGWGGFGLDAGRDRENLAAITEELGPDRTLMVDPGWFVESDGRHRTRTPAEDDAMLTVLAQFTPYWVEDFVHPEQLSKYRLVRERFPGLRTAAGEQQATIWDFRRLVEEGDVDVLQPDLSRCGGLTVALGLPELVRAQGKLIVTHSWLTDLLHAYSLHYLSTLDKAPWVEFNVAQSALSRGVVADHLRLEADGTVAVPTGSGLGVTVDEEFVTARQTGR